MCGITGFLEYRARSDKTQCHSALDAMASSIQHRGPDKGGIWCDAHAGIGLAHRLLAVADSPQTVRQPMRSDSGRYHIVLDGEIYNGSELAPDLRKAGAVLRTQTDAEVILEAVQAWGLEHALQRLNGVFAFALWDVNERRLLLARDRLGVKPLYYGRSRSFFLFGSELRALRAHPAWSGEICRQSLGQLLRCGYIPEPRSIYRGIHKLPPGTCLSLNAANLPSAEALVPGREQGPRAYWSARAMAQFGLADPWPGTAEEAVDALEQKLQTVIRQQATVGAPHLGAFLSGGIDSSAVAAIAQAQSMQPVQTFAIGFDEPSFNEAIHAKAVARHLGTDHTELYISAHDVSEMIPCLPRVYDEPFADPSQIPMILASQMASRRVTEILSGDGGDELFAGYNRYKWTEKVWAYRKALPSMLRYPMAGALSVVPASHLDRLFEIFRWILPAPVLQQPNLGGKLHKFAAGLRAENIMGLYQMLMSNWQEPGQVMSGMVEVHNSACAGNTLAGSLIDDLLLLDLTDYLPGGNLVKVDRAAMSAGLKLKLPLLDQRLVEFAWRIPIDLKVREGQGKWLLRQLVYRYIPPKLLERPKMGFSPPVSSWLRGPLREWAGDLLASERLARQGIFVPEVIRKTWEAHLAGRRDAGLPLWSVLMFQAWADEHQGAVAGLAKAAIADEHQHVFADGVTTMPTG